jgi:NIMA (never in mitosis gene a)-related kinase
MEEITMLGSLSSPYIVSYIDSFISGEKVNIIMEFCDNGDLQSYINSKMKHGIKMSEITANIIWKFFIQMCLGVKYLHSKGILHRDLKSLNIFLNKEN